MKKYVLKISINEWREGIIPTTRPVSYMYYYPSYNKNRIGVWKEEHLYPSCKKFSNVQLRLKDKVIQTSRSCS